MHRPLTRVATLTLLLLACPAPAQEGSAAPPPGSDATTLLPGDAIRVAIWREADLSGEFAVDQAGRIVLPLVGEMTVTEMPVAMVRDSLVSLYRRHLRNPSIVITPLRRVNVLGEVRMPGLYPVDPTITVAGVVALAGGTTPDGHLNRVDVIRLGGGARERVSVMNTLEQMQIRSGDQIVVQRRNWLDRNSGFVMSMLLSATSILVTLAR